MEGEPRPVLENAGAPESIWARIGRRTLDLEMLSNLPVAATFCVLRYFNLIASLPYWVYVVLVLGGGAIAILSAAFWGDSKRPWHSPLYIGVNMGVITVVAYATGWGPIMSIGFVFGCGSALTLFGSRATRWMMRWTVVWMVLGQSAIGLGIAPTLIRQPLVHGLAGLSLLGTLLTIGILGRATAARENVETDLRQSEARFKALVHNATDVILVTESNGALKYASPAFERVLGIASEPYYGCSMAAFLHPDDIEGMKVQFDQLSEDPSEALCMHVRIRDSKGKWRHFEATVSNHLNDPDVGGIVGNLHDITDLLEAHELFQSAFEDAPIGMALATTDGVILRPNRAYESIVGRPAADLVGRTIRELTHPDDWERKHVELRRVVEGTSEGCEVENRYIRPDGTIVWASVHASAVRDSTGRARYLIGQVQDITLQRSLRERLEHAAIHDPLTGIPNRVLFMDRVNMALSRAERKRLPVAVAFLDLDRFKLVNDGLGHSAGDDLLKAVSKRLRDSLRDGDTVARFGGDEFTILLEDLSEEDALDAVRRVFEDLQRPFTLEQTQVFVTASIGVVMSPESGSVSAEGMLRDADTAMYLAKEAGRGRIEVFDINSHAVALDSLHVVNELHSALAEEQFRIHYQPIVELSSGSVVAVEALLRWEHPKRGLLRPDDFISLAEEHGLIIPVGRWVLSRACRQAAEWNEAAKAANRRTIEVNVNISPRQLANPDLVSEIESDVVSSGIEPASVCLELTESTLMGEATGSAEVLRALKSLGVRISIDDFGTGYSSLSYLKRFPIDSLKVDRSFVDGLGEEADDSVIVSAIISLAHSLGISAVAEGVETEIALEELRRLGCDRAQGYLIGYPQPAAEVEELLVDPHLQLGHLVGPVRSSVSA